MAHPPVRHVGAQLRRAAGTLGAPQRAAALREARTVYLRCALEPMPSTLIRPLRLTAPLDLARWHAAWPGRYPALFESAASGTALGRYDILCRSGGESLTLDAAGRVGGPHATPAGFLAALDAWHGASRAPEPVPGVPFQGGWCLYLGYELAAEVERSLRLPRAEGIVAQAIRCPAGVVHDHATGETLLVAEPDCRHLLDEMERDLGEPPPEPRVADGDLRFEEDPPQRYLDAVAAALEHIGRGDVYQANLSRRWVAPAAGPEIALSCYRRLRAANPGPFSGMFRVGDLEVLSTSPERLVEVRGSRIQTRPIAGTIARVGDDRAAIDTLVRSAKDRAEHVMLIDLERNDLGRLCRAGTVEVSEYGVVETYAHVHHLVSNVRGELRPGVSPAAVIRAVFPGGTITGCPKVRCMALIADIEGAPRGAYTGSFGYLNRDGGMDLNILIRTATVTQGRIDIRAGAGVVADSDPGRELEETRAKARGLLRGLGARG